VANAYNGILFRHIKGWKNIGNTLIHATTWINPENIYAK
jgi:hypothetical protein